MTPWTIAYQGPLSMGFSRQGYWSGLPFPSPGDLPNPGIEPRSPTLQADALPLRREEKWSGQGMCPWEGTQRKRDYKSGQPPWRVSGGSSQRVGIPDLGPHVEGKPPWLTGSLLGQMGRLEKPGLRS